MTAHEPGYRYAKGDVDAFAEALVAQMKDETWDGPSWGYVYRDDPRNLAQALMDLGYSKAAV